MKLTVLHTWHVRFDTDAVLYHVSWTKIAGRFRTAGFTVNPLPHSPYGLSVGHSHPGAMTLFTLGHPEYFKYITVTDAPSV